MTEPGFPAPPAITIVHPLRRKVTQSEALQVVVGALIGGVLVAFAHRHWDSGPLAALGIAALLWLPIVWFVTVLVHELGHAVGGRLAGMRLFAMYAGPLHFDFSGGSMRVLRNRVVAPWSGLAVCVPRPDATARDYVLLLAGGPLANVVFTVVALWVMIVATGAAESVAFMFMAVSMFTAVINLLPVRVNGVVTDGAQMRAALRGDPAMRKGMLLGQLLAQSFAGTRPRELDLGLLGTPGPGDEPRFHAVASLFRAAAALDAGRRAAARAAFLELAETLRTADPARLPLATRRAFGVAIAAWIGQHERDAPNARAWLDFTRGGLTDPVSLARAEAAVAFAEGRDGDARAGIAAVRAALPRYGDRGGAPLIAEQLDELERELAARVVAGNDGSNNSASAR